MKLLRASIVLFYMQTCTKLVNAQALKNPTVNNVVVSGVSRSRQKPLDRTPVLPWVGVKTYGDKDCLHWEKVGQILYSNDPPPGKKLSVESKSCRLDQFLECVPIKPSKDKDKDKDKGKPARKSRAAGAGGNTGPGAGDDPDDTPKTECGCMLGMGKAAIFLENSCVIPAGHGWLSECFKQFEKAPEETGFPVPYGDPRGPGIDPNIEQDEKSLDTGNKVIIKYMDWNTIHYPCGPKAVCKESASYFGKRCQCRPGAKLDRQNWTCSKTTNTPASNSLTALLFIAFTTIVYYTIFDISH